MTAWPSTQIWLAIILIGAATYSIRLSFIYFFGRIDAVPERVQHVLRYVPAAVLAALVVPAVVTIEPTVSETVLDDRVIAATIAAIVAWKTEDVFWTIGIGMAVLWAIRFGPALVGI